MSRAHIFMTLTGPYPSQQTHNPPRTRNPSKFWPAPRQLTNRHCWRYFAFYMHKVVDHLQSLDEDIHHDKYLFHQHFLLTFATVRSPHEIKHLHIFVL